ncbi:MAG: hypothetical protein M0R73_00035 [Dehalococcoidia bacterium]|nr:hypothetical protein [Dehalococcoidia bacterium]
MNQPTPGALHVVHIISAALRPEVDPALVDAALERARALQDAPGARRVVLARSAEALLAAIWLDDRAALETFAASPEHMGFVMRGLAPCIAGMWSAAVETPADPPPPDQPPEALWVFAVRASDTAFEWQVRDLVQSLEALPAGVGVVAAGPTFEERDRYRAGGVACVTDLAAFQDALEHARTGWGEIASDIVAASAGVVR